jgi:hypothetical protein
MEIPMLRYAIIGFAAAALTSIAVIPDEALARSGGGFRGGAWHATGRHPAAFAERGGTAGAALGVRGIGQAVGIRAVVAGSGARAIGGYYGSPYGGATSAAQAAQNARALSEIERRQAVIGADVGAALAAVRAPPAETTVGTPAPGGFYGGVYHDHNSCYRDSHGSLVCPFQSSAAPNQGP